MGLPTSSGFVLLLFFFFFHKQSPCEFCRSFNHLVPDSWSHHILQSSPPKQDKSQKEQEEPERSFTQKAGLLWCLEERLQPAPRELTCLHEACRLQWTPSKGEFLKFHLPSQNCDTEFRLSSRETHVPLWSCGPPCGFQISLCEKSDWTTLPAHALFEIDEKSVSNSQFLPWAPLSPRGLFCHSLIKELSKGFRVQAALRRSSCLFLRIKDS